MSLKRPRSPSPMDTSAPTEAYGPPVKFQRVEKEDEIPIQTFWCRLPPTCAPPNDPTYIEGAGALEKHYERSHAYVCHACNALFHQQSYLDLHHTELHDPLAAIRREGGASIHKCLVQDCNTSYPSANARRKHLIESHGFKDTFFFAVVKYGVGYRLRTWAEMDQPEASTSKLPNFSKPAKGKTASSDRAKSSNKPLPPSHKQTPPDETDAEIEAITEKMEAVSVVPKKVRFGRGGKRTGFAKGRGIESPWLYSSSVFNAPPSPEVPQDPVSLRFMPSIDIGQPERHHGLAENDRGRGRRVATRGKGRGRGRGRGATQSPASLRD